MNRPTGLIRWLVLLALTALLAVAGGDGGLQAAAPPVSDDLQRGLALWEKGDFDAAIASLTKAIGNRPGDANLLLTRGLVYFDEHDLDNAIADFSSALERDKGNTRALSARARAYYEQGRLDKAMDDVTHALAAQPNAAGRKPLLDVATGKPLTAANAHDEAPKDQEAKPAASAEDPFLSLLPALPTSGKRNQAPSQDLESQKRAAASRLSAQNRARALERIRANQQQDQKNLQGIAARANSHR
jgi:tetratricopeptide (TPR) repeat protein